MIRSRRSAQVMPLRRIRVAVVVDGIRRALFSVVEKATGELIIPLTFTPRYMVGSNPDWDTSPSILEQRISIHPSPNSEAFTTIKRTTVLADGKRITAVALSDAVKRKTGFSGIFVRRSEDLSGDGYAPLGKLRVGDRLLMLPEIDPKRVTLFSGLYLGHPDVEFDVGKKDPMLHIVPMKFRRFQLVAMFSLQPMRSHYSSEFASNVTRDPAMAPPHRKELCEVLMTGKSPDICLTLYQTAVWNMARRVLNWELRDATDPIVIKDIKARLRRIPKLKTLRAEWSKGNSPTHILYGDQPAG